MQFQLGDRVELTDGILVGERATIVQDEEGEWRRKDGDDDEEVYIQFDRKDAHLGREKGFAILTDYWEYIDNLKVIS